MLGNNCFALLGNSCKLPYFPFRGVTLLFSGVKYKSNQKVTRSNSGGVFSLGSSLAPPDTNHGHNITRQCIATSHDASQQVTMHCNMIATRCVASDSWQHVMMHDNTSRCIAMQPSNQACVKMGKGSPAGDALPPG